MLIGVISDTHGLLRPEATRALRPCEAIIHAGDIGKAAVLHGLRALAPVYAIRGNVDAADQFPDVPETCVISLGGCAIKIVHDANDLTGDPASAGIDVVVSGHSHRPSIERREGVLYLNPGAAGPRRFKLPVSLAHLQLTDGLAEATLLELAV